MLASLKEALSRVDPALMALALALYAVSVPLVAQRWRVVLRAVIKDRVPLGPLVLASLASSFVNNVTPSARLGGESCRVILLVQLGLATTLKATAAIAYERLSELPAVALLAAATLVLAGRASRGIAAGLTVALIGGGLLFVMRRRVARGLTEVADRWRGLSALDIAPSALAASAGLSGIAWALDVARLAVIAAAFGAPIGVLQAATLSAITIAAGWVPTVGGLGAIEGGMIAGLMAFGVKPVDAGAITIAERAISYGLASAAGAAALSALGGRRLWRALRPRTAVSAGAAR